jgi:hypothetical protein
MAADGPVPYDVDGGEYHRGDMNIAEQRSTYEAIMGLTKWSSLAIAVLLVFLTLTFATEAGWLSALIVSAVLTAAGVFFLREKRPAGASPDRPH